jgi:hypothetical protein
MCTFHDERTVQVCDLAIANVRAVVQATFGAAVTCTPRDGAGTFVQAGSGVDLTLFGEQTRAAIAAAQRSAT